MPRSVDIADFAAKLGLVCKKLNWSRSKLAQQAGTSRPTGNSLMRLNDVLGKALPAFSATMWDLPSPEFGKRFGLVLNPAAPTAGPASFATIVAGMRSVVRFEQDIDDVAPMYCGLYRAMRCASRIPAAA